MKKGGVRDVNSFISINTLDGISESNRTTQRKILSISNNTQSKKKLSSVDNKGISKNNSAEKKSVTFGTSSNNKNDKILLKRTVKTNASPKRNLLTKPNEPTNLKDNPNITERNIFTRRTKTENDYKTVNNCKIKKNELYNYNESNSLISQCTDDRVKSINNFPLQQTLMKKKINVDDDFECEYEDDFEDYESDFESYSESQDSEDIIEIDVCQEFKTSTAEKKKIDSDDYDLMNQQQLQQKKIQLEVIKKALYKENTMVLRSGNSFPKNLINSNESSTFTFSENNNNLILDFNKRSTESFFNVKRRQYSFQISQQIKKTDEKLLRMVSLDTMNYNLFEMVSMPYDIFMRIYARKNTTQVFVQTNEDNISIETQTEEILHCTKWTQQPPNACKELLNGKINNLQILSGVGNENDEECPDNLLPNFQIQKLNEFMKFVGEELIALLEEELFGMELNTEIHNKNGTEISECISYIKINSFSFLLERPILILHYDPNNVSRILTIHGKSKKSCDVEQYSLLCIWNIHQPWKPKILLKSYNHVTCSCFAGNDSMLVFAGHEDGSICAWNLREKCTYSEKLKFDNNQIIVRSPSYNTARILNGCNHKSRVTTIENIKSNNEIIKKNDETLLELVCSVEENNKIIIWNVFKSISKSIDTGSAPWSTIKFFINQTIDLVQTLPKSIFQTTTSKIVSECNVLAGTNCGIVLKYSFYGQKCKMYKRNLLENFKEKTAVTCLEVCPYNQRYFAVGYSNGNVNLFDVRYTNPVCTAESNNFLSIGICSLQWLWNKLDYVLALDYNSTFNIYRFHSQNCELILRVKANNVSKISVSPFTKNSPHSSLNFVLLLENEIQVHKFKSTKNF